jgi:hypothetical protein
MKSMLHFSLGRLAWGVGTRDHRASFLRTLLRTHRKFILGVEPVDALEVYPPAFSPQDHGQPPVPKTHPARCQLAQAHAQSVLGRSSAPVSQSLLRVIFISPAARRPLSAKTAWVQRPQLAPPSGLYSFFCTISCRMWRSSERSATSRLSLPFSSRS